MSEYRSLRGALEPEIEYGETDLTEMQRSRQEMAERYVAVRSSVTDDDAIDIIQEFADGKNNAQIAEEFGLDINVPRALVAYACDRDPEIYRRHLDPPKGKDPEPMSRNYILHRVPSLI